MSKVFLGVGHGGTDTGAVGYIKEADVNLNMALACREYLVANGVDVMISRTKDENVELNEKIRKCNEYNPDLAIDIHNNSGGGNGFEVYHSIFNGRGKILAENIETEVKAIGQNSRGLKTRRNSAGNDDYYGFIRNTKVPAVIVEGFFVDNEEDFAQADTLDEQKSFGIAYAKGILKTLDINTTLQPQKTILDLANEVIAGKYGVGEERKQALGPLYNEVQSKVNEIIKGKSSNITLKSIEVIAREVIEGKWGNGQNRKDKLTSAGYNYNTVQKRVNELLK